MSEQDAQALPLERAAGLCFMVGFQGTEPDPELDAMLDEDSVGGVILFTRNGQHATELAARCARVRARCPEALIAMDQEGGAVLRVQAGASELPAAMALGAAGDPELAARVGEVAGRELVAMGADLNLAPVLDVNRVEQNPGIGVRSFGQRPDEVIPVALGWLRGLRAGGALGCAKHFPGKGAARKDAHLELPEVGAPRDELVAQDLPPFRAAVEAGVDAIMTSHVVYPALDPDAPGTFSSAVVGLARDQLGFDGLVISDDLEMHALSQDPADAAGHGVRALAAGHDLLLVCHTRSLHQAMVEAVVAAVHAGALPEARVREACQRVLAARARAGEARRRSPEACLEDLVEQHHPVVARAHLAGITRLRGGPLDRDRAWRVYLPRLEGLTQVEEGASSCEVLARRLQDELEVAGVHTYAPRDPGELPGPDAGEGALLVTYNAHLLEAQAELVRRLDRGPGPLALACLRNPYDARLAPGAESLVLAFGFRPLAQAQLAAVLLGEAEPQGRFRLEGLS